MLWPWETGCLVEASATEFQSRVDLQKQTRTTGNARATTRERIAPETPPRVADNVSRHIPLSNEPKVDFEKNFTKFSRPMGVF